MRTHQYRTLYLIYNIENGTSHIDQARFFKALKKKPYCVQYRSKQNAYYVDYQQAKKIKRYCIRYHVPFIINDSIQLARRVGADGLHIGETDGSLMLHRKNLNWKCRYFKSIKGNKRYRKKHTPIIGMSCYNHLRLAVKGKKQGADYLAFGVLFPSPTKPESPPVCWSTMRKAKALSLPIVAIGGITPDKLPVAKKTHAHAYAMISGINQLPVG